MSPDGTVAWIEYASGGTATIDGNGSPLDLHVGAVLLVRAEDNTLASAPVELWPDDTHAESGRSTWIGVVKLKLDDISVVDTGARWQRVPTNPDIEYTIGNTVEANDAIGVTRVLAERPLKYIESSLDDTDVLARFRSSPSKSLSFDDFGGHPEVVQRARELIELPLRRREALARIGAGTVKGVLFTGLPGTGKTMLARIMASVAGAEFYEISGPTVFSKWYGESEEILRRIFDDAAANAPAIIFFDEIDSVAGQRNEEAHEASKRVVAQLLTLMDGFTPERNVTVIAATNRPQDIDVALRRPGRFDWQIDFPLPDLQDRVAILHVTSRSIAHASNLPFGWIAAQSEGWSAAELAAIWKEAALLAVADDRAAIATEDLLGGYERVSEQRRRIEPTVAEGVV